MKTKIYLYQEGAAKLIDEHTNIYTNPLAVVMSFDGELTDETLFSIVGIEDGVIERYEVFRAEDRITPEYHSIFIYSN